MEQAAAALGISPEEFMAQYGIVDFWCAEDDLPETDVIRPRTVGERGTRATWASAFQSAPCIFLDATQRCQIHAVKPLECKQTFGCDQNPMNLRPEIARQWHEVRQGEKPK